MQNLASKHQTKFARNYERKSVPKVFPVDNFEAVDTQLFVKVSNTCYLQNSLPDTKDKLHWGYSRSKPQKLLDISLYYIKN